MNPNDPYNPYGTGQQQSGQPPMAYPPQGYQAPPPQYGQQQPQYQQYAPAPTPQAYPTGYEANTTGQPNYADVSKATQPNYGRDRTSSVEDGTRFEYSRGAYRDKFFLFLFLAHLAGMGAIAGMWGQDAIDSIKKPAEPTDPTEITFNGAQVFPAIMAAAVAGGVFAALWLKIMQNCADTIIKISLVANVIFLVGLAGASAYVGEMYGALIFLLFALFGAFYYYCVRNRIPFTQAVIKASCSSLQTHPGPVGVSYGMLVLQVIWVGVWSFVTLSLYLHLAGDPNDPKSPPADNAISGVTYFCLLVSLYWTSQVFKNIGHVTTSGTVATWWLMPDKKSPTCGAFKRATTTSLGSICFGSLLVALLQATRAMVREARRQARRNENGQCLLCCFDCILGLLERAVEFINVYAFVHVAVYGKDFISGAKATWRMLKERGIDVLINDDLTGMVLFMGCLLGGVVSCGTGAALAYMSNHENEAWAVVAVISFLVGLAMTALVMSVVSSAVSTTFVLWAECPEELARARPREFNEMREAAMVLHPHAQF